MTNSRAWARVLTIAGSDSGGGAGIQADLKTFQELEVFGMSAITAVTAQNSVGVHGVYPLPVEAVVQQIDAVLGDMGATTVKTGMLLSPDIVACTVEAIRRHRPEHVIVDPVMIAKGGSPLLRQEAVDVLRGELLPLASVVTPNLPEACELLGIERDAIRSVADMVKTVDRLLALGPKYVLLKGGHLEEYSSENDALSSKEAIDVLVGPGLAEPVLLQAPRYATKHTHGTGCTTAAAIAAFVARGRSIPEAAREAKQFVTAAIAAAGPMGRGTGTLWHAAHRQLQMQRS
ncbi:hydroxymethylpyrimidine/phosphomethylpyrimidine kinase [Paenibacillus phyllosphaerae]|uniref:Hydroxymethylpyrimidine/phosphomethylpyrimidine kinase n=1 Tax=Paenibacillus phyllosphaerae TaxID=274593 RepID=A0A7W5B3C1_9BACL|nr:bifunctional hydroxymethylpyrimidine kinase/phosphomethylpyrimidine kinase [Paenibacillus phyllosphaerae]MBB3113644.1 hydroxymethylpyrimidine/phosphomethylpyrimidine kinase [Paenibacillus phyllosphaerae]